MDRHTGKPAQAREYTLQHHDKRVEPRLKTTPLAVKILGECKRTYGYARDISCTGMQIRTFTLCDSWPKPVGENISIEFSLPGNHIRFSCSAKVMWNHAPLDGSTGMSLQGVVFEDIDPSVKAKIGEIAGMVN